MLKKFKPTIFKTGDPLYDLLVPVIIVFIIISLLLGYTKIMIVHKKELASSYETTTISLPNNFNYKLNKGDRIQIKYLKENNTIISITTED